RESTLAHDARPPLGVGAPFNAISSMDRRRVEASNSLDTPQERSSPGRRCSWRCAQFSENPLKRGVAPSESGTVATIARDSKVDQLHFLTETLRLLNAGAADLGRVMTIVLERSQAATGSQGAAVALVENDALVYGAVDGTLEPFNGRLVESDETLSGL